MMKMSSTSSTNDYLYRSPTAVVDMRLMVDEDKLIQNFDSLRPPMSRFISSDRTTESSPPPLNGLSACSCSDNNDDSSSVSSVSLDDDNWDTPAVAPVEKRSIFPRYWDKVGGRPAQSFVAPSRSFSYQEEDEDQEFKADSLSCSAGDNSYEHLLEKNETVGVRRHSNLSSDSNSAGGNRRRRLWGDNHYVAQSVPSFAQYVQDQQQPIRKTKSSPAVGPTRSCLRRGRYSNATAAAAAVAADADDTIPSRRSSEATSMTTVSFSDDLVQVRYLKPVTENYASRGWSKYFA